MRWVPEPYPSAGGLAAAGFYKLLGRPRLDPLAVLVRETAQNSWDARLDDDDPVVFAIAGWNLTTEERDALRRHVFVDAGNAAGTGLSDELASPGLMGLYVSDRATKGLGGPFRADEASPDDVYDWVDFVLNVGKANKQGHTGGTYGFGKTISYVVSAANAVVVHSRTRHRGRTETRLIACAIGTEFRSNRRLFTGRHWWGEEEDGVPLPVRGAKADRIAALIGMPAFEDGELGTNILVVAPDLGGRTPHQAMTFIAESVTWHLWPKLTPRRGGHVPMHVTVSWNGEPVAIPTPDERPPLNGFAQAFDAIVHGIDNDTVTPGTKLEDIRCGNPKTKVGDLATVPLSQRPRVEVDDGSDPLDADTPDSSAVIVGPCHHVALLRTPELVVEYLQGPAPPEGGIEWAGVFRACDEHDEHFAAAEPPTHDSWQPSLLPKSRGRTIVNVGIREINTALDRRWRPKTRAAGHEAATTALVADELAHLVRTVEARGKGKRSRQRPDQPPRTSSEPRVTLTSSGPVALENGLGTSARVLVVPAPNSAGTDLSVTVGAALEGSQSDPTLDPDLALVSARYTGGDRQLSGTSAVLTLTEDGPVEIEIVVARGPDTTVLFDLAAVRTA